MSSFAISLGGLNASVAQFTRNASNIVRAQTTATDDFAASIVEQKMAMASFRANIAAIKAQDSMTKATLDLIC
jgi:hypothetical protein